MLSFVEPLVIPKTNQNMTLIFGLISLFVRKLLLATLLSWVYGYRASTA